MHSCDIPDSDEGELQWDNAMPLPIVMGTTIKAMVLI